MKTTCGFCKAISVMSPVTGKELEAERLAAWVGVFSCNHCDLYMIAYGSITRSQTSLHGYPTDVVKGLELAERVGTFKWYPSNASTVTFEGLPPNIEQAAAEAHSCLSAGQIIAAAITARATLESVVKDQGITEKIDLYKKVEKLKAEGKVNDLLTSQAHAIRNIGNDMAHGDFDELPDKEEVEHIVQFMDILIDTLYVQPARVKAVEDKRKARRQ